MQNSSQKLMKKVLTNVVTISPRGTITIPLAIRKKYNLKGGDSVTFIEDEGRIVMIPIVDIESMRHLFRTSEEIMEMLRKDHEEELELEK